MKKQWRRRREGKESGGGATRGKYKRENGDVLVKDTGSSTVRAKRGNGIRETIAKEL